MLHARVTGRGGDSIGVAYLDEDQLTLEVVTIETGQPGEGGISWNHDGSMTAGESGEAHETLRFSEWSQSRPRRTTARISTTATTSD